MCVNLDSTLCLTWAFCSENVPQENEYLCLTNEQFALFRCLLKEEIQSYRNKNPEYSYVYFNMDDNAARHEAGFRYFGEYIYAPMELENHTVDWVWFPEAISAAQARFGQILGDYKYIPVGIHGD